MLNTGTSIMIIPSLEYRAIPVVNAGLYPLCMQNENGSVNSFRQLIRNLFQKDRIPLPPQELQGSVGGSGFEAVGVKFLGYFRKYGALKPHEKILDVGCGCGRIAIPLTSYLSGDGCYAGFDINRRSIEWCNKQITPRYPSFHFKQVDLYNQAYNPKGTILSKDFIFPYRDSSFDFVNLSSVFTHLLPEDMEHYLAEIHRVLKPGGRCLITFFLLNDQSLSLMKAKKLELDFQYEFGVYRTIDQTTHEKAVAYNEEHVKRAFLQNGFELKLPVLYGSWCSRKDPVSYQDMIVAYKP